MIDYSFFYKEKLPISKDWGSLKWDLFVSAYNFDERTKILFEKISATNKYWIIFPEYSIDSDKYPAEAFYSKSDSNSEADLILNFWKTAIERGPINSICIDSTGFLPQYLLFLLSWLKYQRFAKIDILYTEPKQYLKKENTKFSDEFVSGVRTLYGFEGLHRVDTSNDLLIINSGYDHKLIANAAEHKDHAKKIQLFGFPSLRADMYQENILRARKAEEAVGGGISNKQAFSLLAPANDPFITANVLSEYVSYRHSVKRITNLYLCPLGTKPQMIGMALFYLTELENSASSIIFPFCQNYSPQSTIGISDIWKYTLEFSI